MRNIVVTYLNHASFIIFHSVFFPSFLFLSPDRYIAPYDGIYQFSTHLNRESSSNGVDLDFYVDGSRVGAHSDLYQTTDFRSHHPATGTTGGTNGICVYQLWRRWVPYFSTHLLQWLHDQFYLTDHMNASLMFSNFFPLKILFSKSNSILQNKQYHPAISSCISCLNICQHSEHQIITIT